MRQPDLQRTTGPNPEAYLTVTDLFVKFPSEDGIVNAVEGVSLSVVRGKTLAVVGESGSGKSVTALAIMGLINRKSAKVSGEVWLDGEELIGMSDNGVRKLRGNKMAMIFQDPMSSLHPFYRIGAQLAEAARVHRKISKAAARAEAIEMLEKVGIPAPKRRVDDYPHQLSGGMRQRVMIAMALMNDPALLIADEPTTALDVTIQAQVLELLVALKSRLGLAMIFISHSLPVVAEIADRVTVMYAGDLVEDGPTAAVFARPRHPYTAALLASAPDESGRAPRPIEGVVPAPTELPPGCVFAPRCPLRIAACDAARPALADVGEGRRARCVRWSDM